jgi:hypothetical protein
MINQCDGCRSKSPTKLSQFSGSLVHVDKLGRAFMFCEAHLYKDETENVNNDNQRSSGAGGEVQS